MTAHTDFSLVIPVFEAEALQAFRQKHLHRPAVVMPPHITVPAPFTSFQDFDARTQSQLRSVINAVPAFQFELHDVARFEPPGVLYLEPAPTMPFLHLHHAICDAFAQPPNAEAVFHLTLAGWHAKPALDDIEAEFRRDYGAQLPIHATAREVWLYEQIETYWHLRETFELGLAIA